MSKIFYLRKFLRASATAAVGVTFGLASKWLLMGVGADAELMHVDEEGGMQLNVSDALSYFVTITCMQLCEGLLSQCWLTKPAVESDQDIEMRGHPQTTGNYVSLNQPQYPQLNQTARMRTLQFSGMVLLPGVGSMLAALGHHVGFILLNISENIIWGSDQRRYLTDMDLFCLFMVLTYNKALRIFAKCCAPTLYDHGWPRLCARNNAQIQGLQFDEQNSAANHLGAYRL